VEEESYKCQWTLRTGVAGYGGTLEPSLQWILNTLDIPINVGDDDPSTNVLHSDPNTHNILLGDEVSVHRFQRAGIHSLFRLIKAYYYRLLKQIAF
jgi:hypothetical protein